MRKRIQPKYIPAVNVHIGDVIRVSFIEDKGIVRTSTGRVAARAYEGSDRVLYTKEGGEIFRWNPSHKPPRVTLLEPADIGATTLEGLEL